MNSFSSASLSSGKTIGFVPTMGALHAGHGSLINYASSENDVVVVSVFVNPTQFNQKSDLDQYPRTFEADKAFLDSLNVDVMFYPSVPEIYPDDEEPLYDLDGLDQLMEGPNRPGHFNGVVQVVSRLFDIVQPTNAYFGEKDFQQLAIIKHMASKLNYSVNVKGGNTIRESDGLAMSSRNVRLTNAGRLTAPIIFSVLEGIRLSVTQAGIDSAIAEATKVLNEANGVELEYLELVNPVSLSKANDSSEAIQACVAVWIDDVRLIDNMRVK